MAEEAEHEYLVQFQSVLADPSQREHRQAERILKRFVPMVQCFIYALQAQ